MQKHWMESVSEQARGDIDRMKASMRQVIAFPKVRQPPVAQQMQAALAQPEQYPRDARAVLAKKLYERYGEQARNVLPYLGLDEVATEQDPFGALGGF